MSNDQQPIQQVTPQNVAQASNERHGLYLAAMALGLVLPTLLWYALVTFQMGAPTESTRWIKEIYDIKLAKATQRNSPKLLIVSGSNGLFGISAQQIERETGFPTV